MSTFSRIMSVLCVCSAASPALAWECREVQSRADARHSVCSLTPADGLGEARNLHLLYLKGNTSDTAYYHGLFLGKEIVETSTPRILEEIEAGLNSFPAEQRPLLKALSQCVLDRYKASVSQEFLDLHKNLERGLTESGQTSLNYNSLVKASLAVELSIYFDGLSKRLHDNAFGTGVEIAGECGLAIPYHLLSAFLDSISNQQKLKMGCTGLAAAAPATSQGALIHSRNFDSSLLGYFEKVPVVVFQDPPKGHKWVGIAGAGVPYAPAITGFNDAGISVSLHEMQTEEYRTFHMDRRGAVAGWLATKVLEEASSIDEAWAIVQRTGHFGAWTLFISDARRNETASIEFSGKRADITRRTKNSTLGQSNHFLSPKMEGAQFEYSYNKTLESRARLALVTQDMIRDTGKIDVQWMVNELAGHRDYYVGLRSFGRTVTKAYTTMSHIVVPSRGEFWTTMGDTYPVSSGTFAGVKVNFDFASKSLPPLEIIGTKRAQSPELAGLDNFRQSLYHYTLAYIHYRDHGNSGADFVKSHEDLTKAMELAALDGIFDFPQVFMRARIGILAGGAKVSPKPEYLVTAVEDLLAIIAQGETQPNSIHPYELGLAHMWLARAIDLMSPAALETLQSSRGLKVADFYYGMARDIHTKVAEGETRPYFLYRVMDSYMDRTTGKFLHYTDKDPVGDAIDFVTVE